MGIKVSRVESSERSWVCKRRLSQSCFFHCSFENGKVIECHPFWGIKRCKVPFDSTLSGLAIYIMIPVKASEWNPEVAKKKLSTWMSLEVSRWLAYLYMGYIGVNPLILNHLLTSWDIQVGVGRQWLASVSCSIPGCGSVETLMVNQRWNNIGMQDHKGYLVRLHKVTIWTGHCRIL